MYRDNKCIMGAVYFKDKIVIRVKEQENSDSNWFTRVVEGVFVVRS